MALENQASLRKIFDTLMHSVEDNVAGVLKIDSGVTGPTVGITICTHGNEPAGLSVADYFMRHPKAIGAGTLYIIHNNPLAMEEYFTAECDEGRQAARYVDRNMNRLPTDVLEMDLEEEDAYEFHRAQALAPIWKKLHDGALDIHSTSSKSPSMLITDERHEALEALVPCLPIDAWITGIPAQIRGHFVTHFYGEEHTPCLLLEAGQHEDPLTLQTALQVTLCWLKSLGMVADDAALEDPIKKETDYYHVFARVDVPDEKEDYRLIQPIGMFEYLKEDQAIAMSAQGTTLTCPAQGYALMCPNTTARLCHREALLFLAEKS